MTGRIFIIRHGETRFNAERKLQGHCNSALTAKGRQQAMNIGATLKPYLTEGAYQMYSSPLGRALETSHLICQQTGYAESSLIKDERLMEFSLGDWEERTIESLLAQHPNLLARKDWFLQAPNGESYAAVQARLSAWRAELPADKDSVVVCHGLTSIALRGLLLGLSDEAVWHLDIPQDAFFIVENQSLSRVECGKMAEAGA